VERGKKKIYMSSERILSSRKRSMLEGWKVAGQKEEGGGGEKKKKGERGRERSLCVRP